jgi:hypothetical protein
MSLPGQVETTLPDGRRLISAVRSIEEGARGVLLLEPARLRLDAVPAADMFRLVLRSLDDGVTVTSTIADQPPTHLSSAGVEPLDLPLVGSAALTIGWDDRVDYRVRIGTVREADGGRTRFTVQAIVSPRRGAGS